MEWTDDSVDEALNAFAEARMDTTDTKAMRVALDAAVREQEKNGEIFQSDVTPQIAYIAGRAEALEEAANELKRLGCHGEAAAVLSLK
jgi:hypothetical protein